MSLDANNALSTLEFELGWLDEAYRSYKFYNVGLFNVNGLLASYLQVLPSFYQSREVIRPYKQLEALGTVVSLYHHQKASCWSHLVSNGDDRYENIMQKMFLLCRRSYQSRTQRKSAHHWSVRNANGSAWWKLLELQNYTWNKRCFLLSCCIHGTTIAQVTPN